MAFGFDSISGMPLPQRCDLQAGDVVNDTYKVLSELGGGSFGKVYKVEDQTGNVWALKILRLWEVAAELRPVLFERFQVEYDASLLPGENIVHSVESGLVKGNPYIVMEYCGGGTLDDAIEKGNVDVNRCALAVLNGLEVLHLRGVSHRDLKPENVLIKNDGTPALTDFGILGNKQHRMTQRNIFGRPFQMFGTYAYMSPEQLTRQRGSVTVLPSTDVFSFGVLVYLMLTGKLPFGTLNDAEDLVKYQKNVKSGHWDQSTLFSVPGGKDWGDLINACLTVDIKDRPADATAVKAYLPASCYQTRPQNVKPISVSEPVVKPEPVPVPEPTKILLEPEVSQDSESQIAAACLVVKTGIQKGLKFNLDEICRIKAKSIISAGRQEDNDIVFIEEDAKMSRYHFTLERADDKWILKDGQWDKTLKGWKSSLNGTALNDVACDEEGVLLKDGDNIQAGTITIQFINN